MITRFDVRGEVHVLDDGEVVDVNMDKVAKAILQAIFTRRPVRRRLPAVRRQVVKR